MEKKIGCEFNKRPQLHKGYEDSLRQSRVITLILLRLWQLHTTNNWIIFFLNVKKLSKLRSLGSNLFHSKTADGKNEFLKKVCFVLKMGRLCAVLLVYGASNMN